jgi:hypothetical protein
MNKPEERPTTREVETEERKVYEKPDIMYQAPLEAMASDCATGGKAAGVCTPSFS